MNSKISKIVRQSNKFVEAPYSIEFSVHELKILEYLVAECKELDSELVRKSYSKEFCFSPTELAKILHTSVSRIVADGDKLSKNIIKKHIVEKKLNLDGTIDSYAYIQLINFAEYNNGVFTFALNYKILSYFVEINKNFTEFQVSYLLSLGSAFAIKLYKLLYQFRNIGKRTFTIDGLKEQFGITNKYSLYSNFKNKVLEPSIKQINKHTDLDVSYQEIKFSRKIQEITFNFKLKNVKTLSIEDNRNNTYKTEINNILVSLNLQISENTKKIVLKYIKDKGITYVKSSIEYAKKRSKTNFNKYLIKTLNNGYVEDEINQSEEQIKSKQNKLKETEKLKKQREETEKLDHINKNNIEHDFHKLVEFEKEEYINSAKSIVKKHSDQLIKVFPNKDIEYIEEKIAFSIFAVSNNRYYNKFIEVYCESIKAIDLDIFRRKNR